MSANYYSDRAFQVWEFRVGHGSLLIRSPQSVENPTNVDLIFSGVEYLAAPRFLKGLEVVSPDAGEVIQAQEILGKQLPASSVYVLASAGRRFLIVAAALKTEEREGDIFDSPFD